MADDRSSSAMEPSRGEYDDRAVTEIPQGQGEIADDDLGAGTAVQSQVRNEDRETAIAHDAACTHSDNRRSNGTRWSCRRRTSEYFPCCTRCSPCVS